MDLRNIGAEVIRQRETIHRILESLGPSDVEQGLLVIKASLLNQDLRTLVMNNAGEFLRDYTIDFKEGAIVARGLVDIKQLGPIDLQYKIMIQEFRFDQTGHKIYATFQETASSTGNFAQKLAVKTALLNGPLLKTAASLSKSKSLHDYLTGLYNRRYYEEELSRLDVDRNLPLTIVMGDVNGLKLVNDSFGHEYGDQLLQRVAGIMKRHCRNDDIIARFGGDEFVILLPNTTTGDAELLLERIVKSLGKESIQGIDLSVAFGIATKLAEEENIDFISRQAEDSMYRHKLLISSSVRSKTIDIIMNTLYEKNNREMLHSKRVSHICEKFAAYLKLKSSAVERLKAAGLVHDIGKIGIDEKILNSPGKLSTEEWEEMKKHSEIGYRILSSSDEFSEIALYVLEHQEKWDGTGYPRGIGGLGISREARIISIADAFDAMREHGAGRQRGEVADARVQPRNARNVVGPGFEPVREKVGHGLDRPRGVAGVADADKDVPLADADDLLVNLARGGVVEQMDVFAQEV